MLIYFDIETTGKDPTDPNGKIVSVSWAKDNEEIQHGTSRQFYHYLASLTEAPLLVGHFILQFDIPYLALKESQYFQEYQCRDTHTLATQLIEGPYGLLDLAKRFKLLSPEELARYAELKESRAKIEDLSKEELRYYNNLDVRVTRDLYKNLRSLVHANTKGAATANIALEACDVTKNMYIDGVKLDVDRMYSTQEHLRERSESLKQKIRLGVRDEALNPNSADQLADVLYNRINLPVLKKTEKDKPSVSEDAILLLKRRFRTNPKVVGLLDTILEYRSVNKTLSFIDSWDKLKDSNNIIRPRYSYGMSEFGGTKTGRLSSSKPNIQQVERGGLLRPIIIPSVSGNMFLHADYSQVELRVAAALANERGMLDVWDAGRDLHTQALADSLGRPYEEVEKLVKTDPRFKEQRTIVKQVNFGALYGMGPRTLQEILREMNIFIPTEAAKQQLDDFWNRYPSVREHKERVFELAKKQGYIENIFGQRRYLHDLSGQRLERIAYNTVVQGSAGFITLIALAKSKDYPLLKPAITVHDSIVFEVYPDDLEGREREVIHLMTEDTRQVVKELSGKDINLVVDVNIEETFV